MVGEASGRNRGAFLFGKKGANCVCKSSVKGSAGGPVVVRGGGIIFNCDLMAELVQKVLFLVDKVG